MSAAKGAGLSSNSAETFIVGEFAMLSRSYAGGSNVGACLTVERKGTLPSLSSNPNSRQRCRLCHSQLL
jgi:hypothetical protein